MAVETGISPAEFPTSLDYPAVPVGSIIAAAARRYGDRVAFAQGSDTLTFTELYRRACQFANALRAAGIQPGDRVAVHLPNSLAYPVTYFGIQLACATFCPTNPLLPPDDLAAQLADCGAVLTITSGPSLATLVAIQDRTAVRTVVVVDPADELVVGQHEFRAFHAEATDTDPKLTVDVHTALAHIAYTGGTTGRSKGVCLTHRNVVVNTLQSASRGTGSLPALDAAGDVTIDQVGDPAEWPVPLGTGKAITLTPWFHAMGVIGGLTMAVMIGSTLVLHERLDPGRYLADAERLRVTSISGAPALFAVLMTHPDFGTRDLSSVRSVTSGAAPMSHEMVSALRARFNDIPVVEGYGMTELTMGAVTGHAHRSGLRKVGSVGTPAADTRIKIVPLDGSSEEPLPANTEGEICLRGPQVMAGYYQRPEETAAAIVDGWLHTGDIGLLDDDGYLFIVDRKKDMLLYKGYNVYPRELEEILFAQPGVRTAAVIGRPRDDVGELPVAFVVRQPDAHLDANELMATINAKVLPYKKIRELHFIDDIPISNAGKVLKRELRKRLPEFP
ncbi:MAG TPA: AMP-binding protein [Pseudonocardiaceae bacterium]|jgi:long-chain acyl-CoA synthetase|nr:AMP-binding protein [Pseudonocardiaceae bacterium]